MGFFIAPSAGDFIRPGALITPPFTTAAASIITSIQRLEAGARGPITDFLLIMAAAFATERVMEEEHSLGIRGEVSLTRADTGAVAFTAVDSMAEVSVAVAFMAAEEGFTAAVVSAVAATTRMQRV